MPRSLSSCTQVKYTFSVTLPGTYSLFTYVPNDANREKNVPYTITQNGATLKSGTYDQSVANTGFEFVTSMSAAVGEVRSGGMS